MPDQQKIISVFSEWKAKQLDNDIKRDKQVSFYLTDNNIDKLEDLVYEYKKRTKDKKVNRNDIVSFLIDKCILEALTESKVNLSEEQ